MGSITQDRANGVVSIELPIDLHDKLKEMAYQVAIQDKRGTAPPYFYQIKELHRVYGLSSDFSDDFIWVSNYDGENFIHPDDVGEDFDEDQFYKVYYRDEYVYRNSFFTEKGIMEHVKRNKHHYKKPLTFLTHAFRNEEMALIFQLFKHLK